MTKLSLSLSISGVVATLAGFALLFGSFSGTFPTSFAMVGFALIIFGPLTLVAGLIAYALRKPTAKELAQHNPDEIGTWHFRPMGLLLVVVVMTISVIIGTWVERELGTHWRRPISGYGIAILVVCLMMFRQVRDLVFYRKPRRESGSSGLRDRERNETDHWPEYVCAILEDNEGRLLLESRPESARLAPGQLTCFGGRRERSETPEQCLHRELQEELNWQPASVQKQVELWVGEKLIAWFYHGKLSVGLDRLRFLPGHQAQLVRREELSSVPLSPWHAATLEAWQQGETVVKLNEEQGAVPL